MAEVMMLLSRQVWPYQATEHEEVRGDVVIRFLRAGSQPCVNIFKLGERFPMAGTPCDTIGLSKKKARLKLNNVASQLIASLEKKGGI